VIAHKVGRFVHEQTRQRACHVMRNYHGTKSPAALLTWLNAWISERRDASSLTRSMITVVWCLPPNARARSG
jgi:hypothetical protein